MSRPRLALFALLAAGGCSAPPPATSPDLAVAPPTADAAPPPADVAMAPPDLLLGCRDDPMCLQPTPYCDKPSGKCVRCTDDLNCPEAEVCKAFLCGPGCSARKDCGRAGTCDVDAGACKDGCMKDADCLATPGSPRCEVAKRRCVQCLPEMDNCGMGRYCEPLGGNYVCIGGCKGDADCAMIPGGGGKCCRHACTDGASDSLNCGACDAKCGQGQSCVKGKCQ